MKFNHDLKDGDVVDVIEYPRRVLWRGMPVKITKAAEREVHAIDHDGNERMFPRIHFGFRKVKK